MPDSYAPFMPTPRFVWPNRHRCAVVLCFDVDGETTAFSESERHAASVTFLSQCRYGPTVGAPRLLGLLNHLSVRGSFFVPSWIAEHRPELVRAISDGGHEVAAHGYRHEKLPSLTRNQEEDILKRSRETLERTIGRDICGYRAPWFEHNPWTPELLTDHGFLYDASLMDDDVPYVFPSGLVELPHHWGLEDWEQFAFHGDPPLGHPPQDCAKVRELWWREFEAMRDFGCCMLLTLHPWLSGRPSRVRLLEQLVRDMQASGDVWFATAEEVARYTKSHPDARRETDLDFANAKREGLSW